MQTKLPKLSANVKLKEKFDELLKFTVNLIGIDSTLSDFDSFQDLDEDQAIQVLYFLYKTQQENLGAEGIKCIYSLMQEVIVGDGQKETAITPQSYLHIEELSKIINPTQKLEPIDVFIKKGTELFVLFEPNLENIPGQLATYLAFIAAANIVYRDREEVERKKLISALTSVAPYCLSNLSEIYQKIVQSLPSAYGLANADIFFSFINDVLQVEKINLFFEQAFLRELNQFKSDLAKKISGEQQSKALQEGEKTLSIIARDGLKETLVTPQSSTQELDPIDRFLKQPHQFFTLFEPSLENMPGQLGACLAFIVAVNNLYDIAEEAGRKKLISGLALLVPYGLSNLSKIYQKIVQSLPSDYGLANAGIFFSFINDVLQVEKINLFFEQAFLRELSQLKSFLEKEIKVAQPSEASQEKTLPLQKQVSAPEIKSVSSSSAVIPSVFEGLIVEASCDHSLKGCFNTVLKSISGINLSRHLNNFEEFQKLDVDAAIETLYTEIAVKANQLIVLENVYALMMELVKSSTKWVSVKSYGYTQLLAATIRGLTGKKLDPISAFIEETSQYLFVFKALQDNASSEAILKEIEKLLEIAQKTTNLYYQQTLKSEKEALKKYSLSMSAYLLRNINRVVHIILKNPQSKDYLVHLDIMLTSLKKMSKTKSIAILLGKNFLSTLQDLEHTILCVQQADQFLAYDFSTLVKKQEKQILTWLEAHSKMGIDFLGLRVSDAFKYHYQIHSILTLKGNSESFRKKVMGHYERFKKNLCDYAKNFKFENKDNNDVLLAIFGIVLSGIDIYHSYERMSKFQFQVEMKKIYGQAQTALNWYFCFYIEVLNYIPFFQDKEFHVKMKGIKQLSEKLIEIQKITDVETKYFIQETAGTLLEYCAKNIIIPSILKPINLNSQESVEQLSSLLQEVSEGQEAIYLNALQNFYNAFLVLIRGVSPKFNPSETIASFAERLKHQRSSVESQSKIIETALQKKPNFLTEEKVSLMDKKFNVIESVLKKDLEKESDVLDEEKVPVRVSSFKSVDKKSDFIEKPLEKNVKKDLNVLIAETIPVILVYFKLNAGGCFESWTPEYKSHRYQNKLGALFKALKENFPNMLLNEPKPWVELLHKIFSERSKVFDHRTLIFVVGASYQEKGEYEIALKFYSYCLQFSFFEIPKKENKDIYLITKELIEKHIETCKDEIAFSGDFSSKESSSSSRVVPSVFVGNVVHGSSSTATKADDKEILPPFSPQKSFS